MLLYSYKAMRRTSYYEDVQVTRMYKATYQLQDTRQRGTKKNKGLLLNIQQVTKQGRTNVEEARKHEYNQ